MENKFKLEVGDIVTCVGHFSWLRHYHGEIVKLIDGRAILKKVKDLGTDKYNQWIDGSKWSLIDLKLVEKGQTKNNMKEEKEG